jgi:hypothetical protein
MVCRYSNIDQRVPTFNGRRNLIQTRAPQPNMSSPSWPDYAEADCRAAMDVIDLFLAVYRTVFGRPRQEHLLEYVMSRTDGGSMSPDDLRIDLTTAPVESR